MIKTSILQQLSEIEQTENVHILHAVESGSRAWGFASPDSDYDVRFIYVRKREEYLKLNKPRDVIEWRQDAVLDINGWDLQKALRLLHNSNPTFFEWNSSPIVYKTAPAWRLVQQEINNYFLVKTGLSHYLNIAVGNYREYLKGETVRLKKYFYVVRPLLACKWILRTKSPPPMLFSELVETELKPAMRPFIDDLLKQKMNMSELGEGKRIEMLNTYIDETIVRLKEEIDMLPVKTKPGWGKLDELFLKMLQSE